MSTTTTPPRRVVSLRYIPALDKKRPVGLRVYHFFRRHRSGVAGGIPGGDHTRAKTIAIVTTSSLPWLTGTSVIPLFHAVYLGKRGFDTTLYVPWLPPDQQHHCFQHHIFSSPKAQQTYIEQWLPEELRRYCPAIRFYPAWYVKPIESIGPRIDIDRVIGNPDVVILEEPEHLFASRPWSRIRHHHPYVIGIVMTHYEYYHRQHIPRLLAGWYQHYSRFLMQRMCHRIVAIAPVQQDVCSLPTCRVAPLNAAGPQFFSTPPIHRNGRCYFIGKLIPEKGIEELFRGLNAAGIDSIDLFGYGRLEWTQRMGVRYGVQPVYRGVSYRPWEELAGYSIFINCSRSEYLCTTTADALAMQQWVIIPRHPSNRHYESFRNCLTYSTVDEFVACLAHARSNEPEMDPNLNDLSWDRVADRLIGIIEDRDAAGSHEERARPAIAPGTGRLPG